MKKLLIALFTLTITVSLAISISALVSSCNFNDNRNLDGSYKVSYKESSVAPSTPRVIVIDSCEYILWNYGLTHKGNCKYCAERRRKEYEAFLEDIIIELY